MIYLKNPIYPFAGARLPCVSITIIYRALATTKGRAGRMAGMPVQLLCAVFISEAINTPLD